MSWQTAHYEAEPIFNRITGPKWTTAKNGGTGGRKKGHRPAYPEGTREKVIEYLKHGNSQKSAVEKFGVRQTTVSNWWRERDEKKNPKYSTYHSPEKKLRAMEEVKKGLTKQAISKMFGIHKRTLNNWIEQHEKATGEKLGRRNKWGNTQKLSDADKQKAVRMYHDGVHARKIGEIFGISHITVYAYVRGE